MKKGIYGLFIILMLPCIFAFRTNAQEVQTGSEYNIIIVENGEEVPLAADMAGQPVVFSAIVPFAFLLITLLLIASMYIIQCYKYRRRIKKFFEKDRGTKKLGLIMNWNLFHLKDLENELESYFASSIRIN